MALNDIILTKEGIQKLETELRELIDVERPQVIEQLQFARSQGDLSENADYDAAKTRQAAVEGRIQAIEEILASASLIDDNSETNLIGISSVVKVRRLDNKKETTYQIVGTIEADPSNVDASGIIRISNVSPMGIALMQKRKGDTVHVLSPKPYKVNILEIIK